MTHLLRNIAARSIPLCACLSTLYAMENMRVARLLMIVAASFVAFAAQAEPPRHDLHAGAMPPGAIGGRQLLRGGPLPGYFQPVEIRAPQGAQVAYAMQDGFGESDKAPAKAGMMIGSVYRLKVTDIPRHEGEELYPTIEVIDRLYPPLGQELKFPIPIELAEADLEAAFQGKFITRIIYLENPRGAYPKAEDPQAQHSFEVGSHEDPLVVADRLGRPMAILRIGGRVPDDPANPGATFLYYSPPLLRVRPRPLGQMIIPTTAAGLQTQPTTDSFTALAGRSAPKSEGFNASRHSPYSSNGVSIHGNGEAESWATVGDIQ
ncbi:MAG: hypothetical protein IT427_02855 [Pirellulales bacterium]|nr:hypothetical protein [Pirellulales bacterium]